MKIRPLSSGDMVAVTEIYNHYIRTSHSTFEQHEIDTVQILRRIEAIGDKYPFLVADHAATIKGYAYAHRFRDRSAYSGTVEVSVYVRPGCHREGIGTLLYDNLFPLISSAGFHTIIAGIALPNPASVRLHEHFGMRKVAHLTEVGRKFDRWVDVGYWQLVR